ncbi:MAG TPA: hypothetical protein VE422_34365 [Terriglobia bacterium]|nr:hypothetical protein [Terriglobia bacterium]
MKRAFTSACLVLAVSTSLHAQWLNHPTTGVPRTPDGKPNLNAPTPRAADGKPDFSGIWEPEKNRPCPPDGCLDMQVPQEFLNIGWKLKDGLPFQPSAAETKKARADENGKDDPVSRCLPGGPVKLHTTPLLRKIVQVPGLVVILNEMDMSFRQIFTDARPLPADPEPTWLGYSSAKWDGDTLVVETNGLRDGTWLDRGGTPMSGAAKITERFRRVNYGNLEIDMTIEDPKTFTAPWTIKLNQTIALDTDLLPYVCLENEQDLPHLIGK